MRLFAILALLSVPASADALDRGLHAMVRGDYQTAAQQLAIAVSERPHDPIAHFNYASALRQLGQNEDAIGEFNAALREARDDKTRGDTLYGIAMTRDQQRDPARSAQAWRDYLAFSSGRPNEAGAAAIARENLANAEFQLGTRKAAR
jgi:predicted Zn-dependent protease